MGARSLTDRDQLFDCGRPVDVTGSEGDVLPRGWPKQAGQLGTGGGLARALQAGDQNHGCTLGGKDQLRPRSTHQCRQLLVDDLHHLLAWIEALQHPYAQAALAQRCGKRFDDLEVDVGLEQGEANLAHCRVDV